MYRPCSLTIRRALYHSFPHCENQHVEKSRWQCRDRVEKLAAFPQLKHRFFRVINSRATSRASRNQHIACLPLAVCIRPEDGSTSMMLVASLARRIRHARQYGSVAQPCRMTAISWATRCLLVVFSVYLCGYAAFLRFLRRPFLPLLLLRAAFPTSDTAMPIWADTSPIRVSTSSMLSVPSVPHTTLIILSCMRLE